ncbi:hypothetical protein ACQ4LE_009446 [Meloidogyne hapla]|uniref:UBIQUITIN_CONJUGAT_2 domain-containing protein n=1 Tax=Meloidogyne hapla TaxID=6305 RepID=A0A1I8BF76_MELHA
MMDSNTNCLPSSSGIIQAVGLPQTFTVDTNFKPQSFTTSTYIINAPTSIASRRLFEELYHFTEASLPCCHAFPSSESIFKWSIVLDGPTDTVYANGTFFAELLFGVNYPFSPPEVGFLTKIYHCNINSQGQVCLGLTRNWKSTMRVVDVLKMLLSLFYTCNPHNPLVPHIAKQYVNQYEEFKKMARIWTKRFSS